VGLLTVGVGVEVVVVVGVALGEAVGFEVGVGLGVGVRFCVGAGLEVKAGVKVTSLPPHPPNINNAITKAIRMYDNFFT